MRLILSKQQDALECWTKGNKVSEKYICNDISPKHQFQIRRS